MKIMCHIIDRNGEMLKNFETEIWIKNKTKIYFISHLGKSYIWNIYSGYDDCKRSFRHIVNYGIYWYKNSYEKLIKTSI